MQPVMEKNLMNKKYKVILEFITGILFQAPS